jgi:predicted ATPase
MIDLLERVALRFEREESPQQKLHKLEGFLVQYGLPLAKTVPLFAALLSLPLGADYAPLQGSPDQQKQQTLHAFLTVLLRIAVQQPVLFVMEDLHWVDPTTLELLSLLVDQGPTARILALLTLRPDFTPPWTGRAHLTPVTVTRLPRRQAVEVIRHIAHGKRLPPEVLEQIAAKTDGVPLFMEELTKMVLESGLLAERDERYELTGPLAPLAIPATLHDSLMARLDRLVTVKSLAQLGATLGREFSAALLHAVAPWDAATVQRGLHQLVEAEFLYQRGLPPLMTYVFKHALIQEAAYQSLLRSTRQHYHQRIAQVLEAQFPAIAEMQPELVAHHYTEAGLPAPAIAYWQRAGQHASQRSAHLEAVAHLTTGLALLATLPETPDRLQHELDMLMMLGPVLTNTSGPGSSAVEQVYARARQLCQQAGEPRQLFPVLWGLWFLYNTRAELQKAEELGTQLLTLAHQVHDRTFLLEAHHALWPTSLYLGELATARGHLEQGMALYDLEEHRSHAFLYGGHDPGSCCQSYTAWTLWALGYPDQALQASGRALSLARELAHPASLAAALSFAAVLHQFRREREAVQEMAEVLITLATEQGDAERLARGTILRGWALYVQGQSTEGLAQMRQGLAALQATGGEVRRQLFLPLLAEAYESIGQSAEGLTVLAEALAAVEKTGGRFYEAELYRLKGELLRRRAFPDEDHADTCLRRALEVARRQQAKSLELRAAMSLSRLWQQQGKQADARTLLAPVYGWFTEGFDTADLQDAKALLEALA